MTWFEVRWEHSTGVRGADYVRAVFPSTAADEVRRNGNVKVLQVRCWNERENRWPNIHRIHD